MTFISESRKDAFSIALIVLVAIGALFLLTLTISTLKKTGEVDRSKIATISVEGEGEAQATPDIATFTARVEREAETQEVAQDEAAEVMNEIITFLEGEGIEDRDIKTTSYNIYPRYEYQQNRTLGFPSPEGERVLVGYVAEQSLEVRVRETDRAGELLSGIGSLGATNVSGLRFEVEDEDAAQREARQAAINDAREKAEVLARQLGVSLGQVVSFNEAGYGGPIMYREAFDADMAQEMGGSSAPNLPVGEDEIRINVHIEYAIY